MNTMLAGITQPWAITLCSGGVVSCLSGGVLRSRAAGGP